MNEHEKITEEIIKTLGSYPNIVDDFLYGVLDFAVSTASRKELLRFMLEEHPTLDEIGLFALALFNRENERKTEI